MATAEALAEPNLQSEQETPLKLAVPIESTKPAAVTDVEPIQKKSKHKHKKHKHHKSKDKKRSKDDDDEAAAAHESPAADDNAGRDETAAAAASPADGAAAPAAAVSDIAATGQAFWPLLDARHRWQW